MFRMIRGGCFFTSSSIIKSARSETLAFRKREYVKSFYFILCRPCWLWFFWLVWLFVCFWILVSWCGARHHARKHQKYISRTIKIMFTIFLPFLLHLKWLCDMRASIYGPVYATNGNICVCVCLCIVHVQVMMHYLLRFVK